MNDNDRRNTEDFYAHRKLVLKRIQTSLAQQKKKKNGADRRT